MTPTQLLVPTYVNMLKAMAGWLGKAEEQGPEAEELLSARLAPDMFPLATQIRFACVQALEAVHRLSGKPYPASIAALRDEGVNAGERPGSLAEARARIDETLGVLEGLAPGALDLDADSPIAHALPNGMIFDLTADQYARDWALGQFYFHLMIGYAILRNANVPLGKIDYIPHMLPHLRQAGG